MSQKQYMWIASSKDGAFQDKSTKFFDTKEECYNDMRNSALEKMKWNTEYSEDFPDGEVIGYKVTFGQDKIVHDSYSGTYTYEIVNACVEETTRFILDMQLTADNQEIMNHLIKAINDMLVEKMNTLQTCYSQSVLHVSNPQIQHIR